MIAPSNEGSREGSRFMPRIQDLLDRQTGKSFAGRREELALLLATLAADGPVAIFVHGIAGIGKSRLLDAFAQRARREGATVIRLDCRAVEPTESGLLAELAAAIGGGGGSPEEIAARLGRVGSHVVAVLDTYEVFRLMDTWLRQVFLPMLPDNVRFVLCGREAPATAWHAAPGWQGLFRTIRLESLPPGDAEEFLRKSGVPPEEAPRVNAICHGHPLALTLAASIRGAEGEAALRAGIGQRIVEELSRLYLTGIADPATRRALEAASVVRRVTVPLFAALLPDSSPQDAQERIRALPFVQSDKDGLRIHDAVRDAIAATLRAENPPQHRAYRHAAHSHFLAELRGAATSDLWRCTADLLYLLENPVVREAFFPSGAQEYSVEPARPQDGAAILEIVETHENSAATAALTQWWKGAPETFAVVRDNRGAIAGFYCAFDPRRVPARLCREDAVCRAWLNHLDREPMPRQQNALFLRRWLAADGGETPSAVQAACWVDLKRKYLELRPNLRRVYLTVRDLAPYAPAAVQLGFQVLGDSATDAGGDVYHTAMLDFGASSVDGWLARLVAAELGVQDDDLLDCAARELVLEGRRVGLTRLEFGVMEFLERRSGEAVPRGELLENVWERSFTGGSNVVDVVVRALRKKLGGRASLIETVQGVGYRFRREA
jgi:hypothetical protein